ncbi:uncharacterized protein TNCV_4852261 [Trichonephila clavipes]|nr:uncharacterized protein TNCV_4852261 [Trichonephila clavipes]
MPVLRDTGSSLDKGCENYATPEMFTGDGTNNGNLVKLSDCEVMEAQLRNLVKLSDCEVMEAHLRNEESVPLIQGIKNNVNDDASDKEKASMHLVPVRHELYIDTIGPLPIAPTRDKHILPDMSMSPRCQCLRLYPHPLWRRCYKFLEGSLLEKSRLTEEAYL